jgi:outer membrane protein OmpA-like peptidoglycan-associated protein
MRLMASKELSKKKRHCLKIFHGLFKTAAFLIAFHMLMMSGPYQSAMAAMIGTEAIIDADQNQRTRDRLIQFLAREDIRAALISRGIDPQEAEALIDSLTDAEVDRIADTMEQLPAGSGFFETFLIVLFLVFIVLLFTDIYGYTDVFPFVNKHRSPKTTQPSATGETNWKAETSSASEYAGIRPDENLIIFFRPDSNDLTANAIYQLDQVARFMAKNPETGIKIKGFSDSTGSASYDQMVSEIRANTVKNYLIAKGVSPAKISTAGKGPQGNSAGTGSEEKGRMTSRVEIEFK